MTSQPRKCGAKAHCGGTLKKHRTAKENEMTRIVICLAAMTILANTAPALAQVIEEDVVVRDGWRPWRHHVWDPGWRAECRVVTERRIRPDGTTVIRRIRRCD
jgi:hypothetical protein